MDKIDQQYLNEIVGGTEPGEVDTQHDLKVHEENTTIEELEVHCVNTFQQFFWLEQVNGQSINNYCLILYSLEYCFKIHSIHTLRYCDIFLSYTFL